MKIFLILLFASGFSILRVFGGNAPVFSDTYSITGNLIIPYAELMEPFSAWYDAVNNKSRIDYYGGMVKTYQLPGRFEFGSALKIAPVTTEVTTNVDTCLESNGSSEASVKIQSVLPDLSDFQLIGNEVVNGMHCEVWRRSNVFNDKVNNYTMYIMWKKNKKNNQKVAVPIMYEMKGLNTLFGSHYDHYYLTYSYFSNAIPDQSVFLVPSNMTCVPFPSPPGAEHLHYIATFNPMQEFIHNDARHVDKAWDDFHKYHHRVEEYKSDKEFQLRKYVFHQNFRFIQSKNRANLGFKLAVNHLTDRTSDELRYLRGRKNSNVKYNGGKPFPYSSEYLAKIESQLPDDIDWRLFGAVTPVKDQSVCGSCWSFGTTGTIEGAYFLKTGHQVRLSQQALIDCSWGMGNDGCDGGEDSQAYHWIMKHGGIPSEADYGPYLGQDGYCHIENMTMTAHITGFVNVTQFSEVALKTALVQHGPISIAIDASHKSLSFYSSGIYYDENCGNKSDQLDHAVLLVGYGKLNGKPYWLVKNSWSNYWGNDGYFLISPRDNNCGVMTSPTYVTM